MFVNMYMYKTIIKIKLFIIFINHENLFEIFYIHELYNVLGKLPLLNLHKIYNNFQEKLHNKIFLAKEFAETKL